MKEQCKDVPTAASPDAKTVTLADDSDYTGFGTDFPRAFIPSIDGTVKVTTLNGSVTTITVKAGVLYPIQCRRFWSTGTTALLEVVAVL